MFKELFYVHLTVLLLSMLNCLQFCSNAYPYSPHQLLHFSVFICQLSAHFISHSVSSGNVLFFLIAWYIFESCSSAIFKICPVNASLDCQYVKIYQYWSHYLILRPFFSQNVAVGMLG